MGKGRRFQVVDKAFFKIKILLIGVCAIIIVVGYLLLTDTVFMRHFLVPAFLLAMMSCFCAQAQHSAEKFDFKIGKVTAADFMLPADAADTGAAAFIIGDIGESHFVGNNKGWFSLQFERKVRIKINNVNGVDAADFVIPLYTDGDATEKLSGLKAYSFNLEGSEIVKTELKNDQVFSDKLSKNLVIRKFSVPGAKAGSIIDVTYSIESDFLQNLQNWTFQGEYPRYWSEYTVDIPAFFNYVVLSQGYNSFYKTKRSETSEKFRIVVPTEGGTGRAYTVEETANVNYSTWIMKNVKDLKEEPFTSSLNNHISRIDFQLNYIRFEGEPGKSFMASWPEVVKSYNESDNFGLQLYKNNGWLSDELKSVVAGANTPEEKARKIYCHLRDHYTCTGGGKYLSNGGLKAVQKSKSGNVADINLMMVAMLNNQDIEASPVLLSTRSHGWTHEIYPLMDRFNYVVAEVSIEGKKFYLDATEPGLPFGVLPPQCYNGHARVMKGQGMPVYFSPDSAIEKKTTTVIVTYTDEKEWVASLGSSLGNFESLNLRSEVKKNGKEPEKEKIRKSIPAELELTDVNIRNIDSTEENVKVECKIKLPVEGEDVIYLNPMFGEAYKENPFSSAERLYPVEMPYAMNELFVANIQLPPGYVVDEMPKSAKVALPDNAGMFEYMIGGEPDHVMLKSRIVLNRANYAAEEYEYLREFFSYVVKKQAETIVLKKKAEGK